MITRVRVKNFRSFADIDVKLGQLSVLVGRNGAGKSAFLDILRFVRDSLRWDLEVAIGNRHGIDALRRWSSRRQYDVEIFLTVERTGFWGEYSFVISSSQQGAYRLHREMCRVGKAPNSINDAYEIEDRKWIRLPERLKHSPERLDQLSESDALLLPSMAIFSPLYSHLRRELMGRFYNIHPTTMRSQQSPSHEKQLLEHGENFASVARQLQRNRRRFSRILRTLQRVAEGVTDLRVKSMGPYLVTEFKHDDINPSESNEKSAWFDIHQESDGTLRLLGMLIALHQSLPANTFLALEEPENALHPGALAVLADVIYEAATRNQILVTTQSPDLISRFKASELLVVEKISGISHIGPIDEIQREVIEEQLFTSGDLLRIEGLRREIPIHSGGDSA